MKLLRECQLVDEGMDRDGTRIVWVTQEGFRACELFDLMERFDHKLLERCFDLILGGRYDTAIREASIVLETQLREVIGSNSYGVDCECGVRKKGQLKDRFAGEGQPQAMRDLVSVYGDYRNDFAHNFRLLAALANSGGYRFH